MRNLLIEKNYRFVPFLILLVLADFLFWKEPALCVGFGSFALLNSLAIIPKNWNKFEEKNTLIFLFSSLIVTGLSLFYQYNFINVILFFILILLFRYSSEDGLPRTNYKISNMGNAMLRGLFCDIFYFMRIKKEDNDKLIVAKLIKQIALWIVPIFISIIFVIVFTYTNPIFAEKVKSLTKYIDEMEFLNSEHLIFWLVCALWLSLSIAMKTAVDFLNKPRKNKVKFLPFEINYNQDIYVCCISIMMRALILFNIIFLFYNITDITYIWKNSFEGLAKLPEGISSYANYAHRGAYPLIGVAIFSGLIVILTFHKELQTKSYRIAKLLVYVWLVQNIFLLVSAFLRLRTYVQYYDLTILRVSAFIWMFLIVIGVLILIYKIKMEKSSIFVVKSCIIMVLVTLICSSFWNINQFVGNYNVMNFKQAEKGKSVSLDTSYLLRLGIPALVAIEEANDLGYLSSEQKNLLASLKVELKGNLANWRSWNLQEYLVLRAIEKNSFIKH